MQESYGEGLASHPGPASCVASRKDGDEALIGVQAGQVLSCEMISPAERQAHRGVDAHRRVRKTTLLDSLSQEAGRPRAAEDPAHAWIHLGRESGEPASVCGTGTADRIGKSTDARR